jgi:peptidoglycan/xylan/chitin deacetylase (PgdA/CDA1 family)
LRNLLLSLDRRIAPVDVFFRDDDAGWEDERLLELIARFAEHGLPLDLAVIPAELHRGLAERLAPSHAGLHQHGYAHTNHQVEGRKCEFGDARGFEAQRADIAAGQARLRDLLGDRVDPFFTPPWNRCTRDTGEAAVDLGFRVLSREHRAEPLGVAGLAEVPVHVDWFAKKKGAPLGRAAVGEQIAGHVADGGPVGVMFHHAVMDTASLRRADDLLALLAGRGTSIKGLSL